MLDTNVLVSAAISPIGPPRELLVSWHLGDFELALSYDLLYELESVMLRPYFLSKLAFTDVIEYVIWLREKADNFVETPTIEVEGATPDPDDDHLVSLAISVGADYLVSGNTSHFPPGTGRPGVRFVTPRQFADLIVQGRR